MEYWRGTARLIAKVYLEDPPVREFSVTDKTAFKPRRFERIDNAPADDGIVFAAHLMWDAVADQPYKV